MTDIHLVFHPILNCEEKVVAFCFGDPDRGIKRDYSYELYDQEPIPQDNELSCHDMRLANKMGARIGPKDFKAVEDARPQINHALSQVPTNVALTDEWVEKSDGWAKLHRLFAASKVTGTSYARISKILHKKRPSLIPLIDGQAVLKHRFHENRRPDVATHMVEIAQKIRQDLLVNLEPMQRIQENLRQYHGIRLTLVRIIDILYWQDYEEGRSE